MPTPIVPLTRAVRLVTLTVPLIAGLTTCERTPTRPAEAWPAKLAISVQPSGAQAGAAISPSVAVAVQDSAGNLVTSPRLSIGLRITEGTGTPKAHLRGATVAYTEDGVATFPSLSIDSAGTGYTLTATATTPVGAVTASFDIAAAPAARLAFGAPPTGTDAGTPITPAVQVVVLDSLGNRVPAATSTVTIAIGDNPAGGSLSGTATVAAWGGAADFPDLRIDRSGRGYTLRAAAGGLAGATSAEFGVYRPVGTVSAGWYHACAIAAGGAGFCWGANWYGQLGTASPDSSLVPAPVAGGLTFASISAGPLHTCGVTTGGAAYCWGANWYGQIGRGTKGGNSAPSAVAGGLTFAAVSAGYGHTCGITPAGAAYCWGDNSYGQLGTGSTDSSLVPAPVAGGLIFASVSAAADHTCGVTTTRAAYCWGINYVGQLGSGSSVNSTAPVSVTGGLLFAAIDAGWNQTCGITTGGVAYCWGDNAHGELGYGSIASTVTPLAVVGGIGVEAISAGMELTCALMTGGAAYCWGYDGVAVSRPIPAPIGGGLAFATISSGGATCGVSTTGGAYCWGSGSSGRLGDGTGANHPIPTRVSLF